MPSIQAESGHAGRLDSLPRAIDLKTLGIRGDDTIEVDDDSDCLRVRRFRNPIRAKRVTSAGLHKRQQKFDSYRPRIEYLRNEAMDDGYALKTESEKDFQQFVRSASNLRRGNLVLMDNGNLRALWKDGQTAHLGLQFLGSGMVQYVIFRQRKATEPISRVAGRDTFEGLKRQIDAFDLHSLLYE